MAALQMATMALSGSRAVFSLARDLGTTGRIISTDTSIIVSTIAGATTGLCPRAARAQRNTVQSFTAKRCMMFVAMRHLADANSGKVRPLPQALARPEPSLKPSPG
jgi:hypothetical protein